MRRLIFLFLLIASPVTAHEFWLSPEAYQIAPGSPIVAEMRVGEELSGSGYPYLPNRTVRFDVVLGDTVHPVTSRIGDRPALNQVVPGEGLAIVVHETEDSSLTYREWEKFVRFAEHKDFTWSLDQHKERGLPETGFRESYRRYAKALVAIGAGEGADRPVGLETEIVALANPYTDPLAEGLPVQVLEMGAPRADAQVELFAKAADGTVEITLHQTNAEGIAVLPMRPATEYLVDAVILRPLTPETEKDAVWRSLWAALTFRTPDR